MESLLHFNTIMTLFKQTDSLAIMIQSNPQLLPVINRFNIALGIGNKTIEEICKEKNVNMHFFLAIVNTYQNPNYFHDLNPKDFSPKELVEYLKKTHAYYINISLPKLENILENLNASCQNHDSQIKLIQSFYLKYKKELIAHIEDEESRVFPYVIRLAEQKTKEEAFSILTFEKEHTNVEEKINDLKNLIIRHVKPNYDINLGNEFLLELTRFEKDIADHARIEDNLLIPLVKNIEDSI